ncbi:MAG: hypothetical protein LUE11_01790 [Clostridia bacterium]|nr:hypothetical protein [Clostridia bacterium]
MQRDRYWKYGCFGIAVLMLMYSVHIARLDALLRRCCKNVLYHCFFGQYGLYLLFLLMAAFLLFAMWQWITARTSRKRIVTTSLAAVCIYAVLAHGYLGYHYDVYTHSSQSEQKKYNKYYDKGLLYDLKGLIK